MKTVVITGAGGNIGGKIARALDGKFELRRIDRLAPSQGSWHEADLSRWNDRGWTALFQGVDAVVHCAANPDPRATWESVRTSNIDATLHVLLACAQAGVNRLVFTSSTHVMGGYKNQAEPTQLTTDLPPRPGTQWTDGGSVIDSLPYGYSKFLGENFCRSFAVATDLSVVVLRIGWVLLGDNRPADMPPDCEPWFRQMWLSNRDLCNVVERAIQVQLPSRFVIVNAMSDNAGMRWDIDATRFCLHYRPEDGIR
jgi:NAD+ dependent glucose-6-phosphate dehydrogenase